eukprot:9690152-Alexandrium_andersonii.AAC.1
MSGARRQAFCWLRAKAGDAACGAEVAGCEPVCRSKAVSTRPLYQARGCIWRRTQATQAVLLSNLPTT